MPDTPSTLAQQVVVGFKINATDEETVETITAADCRRPLAGDTVSLPDPQVGNFQRPVIGTGLDRDLGRITTKAMRLAHSEEVLIESAGTAPPFAAPLMACGIQQRTAKRIAVSAPSGTFEIGEDIGDGAGKTAVLVDLVPATGVTTHLVYAELAGGDFVDGDTITGASSLASADVGVGEVAEAVGFVYHPLSESTGTVPPAGTCKHYRGGRSYGSLVRGSAVIRFEESNPGVIDFDFVGPAILVSGSLPVEPAPSGVGQVPNDAPLSALGDMVLDDGLTQYEPPVLPSLQFDLGQQLTPRTTITRSTGATGLRAPRIRERNSVMTFAPEDVPDATHAFWPNFFSGAPVRASVAFGDMSQAGGRVRLHAYRIQYEMSPENRDNVIATGIRAPIRSGTRDDWPFFLAVMINP